MQLAESTAPSEARAPTVINAVVAPAIHATLNAADAGIVGGAEVSTASFGNVTAALGQVCVVVVLCDSIAHI